MEGRQRRSFTDDYKRQTGDLVVSNCRSVGSVAKELGLRDSVLRRWVEQRGARRTTRRRSLVCGERTSDCAGSVTF
jgi:transposase-like protein